jgi:hypothetical protein
MSFAPLSWRVWDCSLPLTFLAAGMASRTGLRITVQGETNPSLSPLLTTTLYRIVHEAFANVTSYAKVPQVTVTLLHKCQTLRCSIRDDGVELGVSSLSAHTGERGESHCRIAPCPSNLLTKAGRISCDQCAHRTHGLGIVCCSLCCTPSCMGSVVRLIGYPHIVRIQAI